ncbi:MAG: hypothetical protein LUM44_17625 [Pyrinomonadaceae bacterium]|nr:hypothetical protein [Pyrinomonadaceae bacterium]
MKILIDLSPVIDSAVRDLKAAASDETDRILENIADYAPEEIRNLMDLATRTGVKATSAKAGSFTRSASGEVPAKDSFELYDSLKAEKQGNSVVLEMSEHGYFLDPVFDGENAGYLNRPFVEKGLENAVKRLESV